MNDNTLTAIDHSRNNWPYLQTVPATTTAQKGQSKTTEGRYNSNHAR